MSAWVTARGRRRQRSRADPSAEVADRYRRERKQPERREAQHEFELKEAVQIEVLVAGGRLAGSRAILAIAAWSYSRLSAPTAAATFAKPSAAKSAANSVRMRPIKPGPSKTSAE